MKIVITRTGATIIAAFTIAICHRLGTVWDYSTNHLVTFNYQPERFGGASPAEFCALQESGGKEAQRTKSHVHIHRPRPFFTLDVVIFHFFFTQRSAPTCLNLFVTIRKGSDNESFAYDGIRCHAGCLAQFARHNNPPYLRARLREGGQIWICNAFCWLKFFQDYFPADPSACLYRTPPPSAIVFFLFPLAHCRVLREHPLDVETSLALLKSIDPVIYRVTALATSLWRLQPRKSIVGITSVPRSGYNARVCRAECSFIIEITRITCTWKKWNNDVPTGSSGFVIYTARLLREIHLGIWNSLSAKYSFYTYFILYLMKGIVARIDL